MPGNDTANTESEHKTSATVSRHWRHSAMLLAGAFCVGSVLIMVWIFLAARSVLNTVEGYKAYSPVHTETGYAFPDESRIARVIVKSELRQEDKSFDVPRACWSRLFAALSPSEVELRPAPWTIFGVLSVHAAPGQAITVSLFALDDYATGAFAVNGKNYRGGNTAKLKEALANAYEEHLRLTSNSEELQSKP